MKTSLRFLLLLLFFAACSVKTGTPSTKPLWVISSPSGEQLTKIDKTGKTVIPNGRFITPAGKNISTAPHPYGVTRSPNGTTAFTANSRTNP